MPFDLRHTTLWGQEERTWPDAFDITILVVLLAIIALGAAIGLHAWLGDFRGWLRACRRALILMHDYLPNIPKWARHKTPRCLAIFGLRLPCGTEDLLRAYRGRVKTMHPDVGGDRTQFMKLQADFEAAMLFLNGLQGDTPPSETR